MLLTILYFVSSTFAVVCKTGGQHTATCATEKCEMVSTTEVCTQCKDVGTVPIDGTCTKIGTGTDDKCLKAEGTPIGDTDVTCGQCTNEHFLFKGGCYNVDTEPGNKICSGLDPENTALCKTCMTGYFKNPANVATSDSCIACSDTTGDGTNVGIANCATCNPPTAAAGKNRNAATCTACDGDNYLKTDENSQTTSCVTAQNCGEGFFATTVEGIKRCVSCSDTGKGGIADCKTCSKSGETVTCSACTLTVNKPNNDGSKCVWCTTENCMKCSDEGVCLQCSTGKLTPTNQCVDKCEKLEGYFDGNDGNCAKCNNACKTCAGVASTQCLSCPARKVLKYTDEAKPNEGGSCVDECRANTGGCADCGAVIGGSRYCSRCGDASQAPLNGNCTTTTRAVASCEQIDNGVCKRCASGYFLLDGGCYETNRQPGKSVCTTESGGKCQACANGQSPSSGVCPACPTNCASCTGTSSKTCNKCLSGYYLDSGSVCRKCSETSGDILGVDNCISCDPPTGNRGFVTCYIKTSGGSGGGDSTGGNNGSNFSTGMIVSISLTIVAVVGGLVGFLCWWFVCRTKK